MWRTRRRSCATKRIVRPEALLQLQQEVHHLRLHRNVERGDELVGDQAFRLDGERPRDADPLPLPAGEFMRPAVGGVGGEAHEIEQLGDAARDLGLRPHAMDGERLAEDLAHAHARVERAVGVLKDHLDAAVVAAELGPRQRADVEAVEADLALVGLDQPHQAAGERGLAAARFADDAERLAARDCEAHAVQRMHDRNRLAGEPPRQALAHAEMLDEAGHLQEGRSRRRPARRRFHSQGACPCCAASS